VQPTSARLVFKLGDAFPVDDPVAVFLVSMSTALSDLLTTGKMLVGGDQDQPFQRPVADPDHLYLLRLSLVHLHEVRESVRHARKKDQVEAFLQSLPQQARDALDCLLALETNQDPWILEALEYVRHQAIHYGGKWNWRDLEWAMNQVADEQGDIEIANDMLAGVRLNFAYDIAIQHFTRKFPEYVVNPGAELGQELIESRVETLFKAVYQMLRAATDFVVAALSAYLDKLPDGVVNQES
jgi:hypothetical protein